ncbi:MAG TPA: hypothetical protein VFB19_03560 [Mycobacterium sp.]|nr:hypothetical protein [Mycobacterium sp.]
MKMSPDTSDPQRDRSTFADAVRFVAIFVVIALVIFFGAMFWVSGCKTGAGMGTLQNCGAVKRNLVAVGPGIVLFVGGAWAFVRTYQTWRARGGWWIWQGAGWFLLVLMLLVLSMTIPVGLL